jgi:hypothetical protein
VTGLLRLVHPPGCPNRVAVMIAAFFDESGSHKDAEILTIAGYVSTAERWCSLTDEWLHVLRGENLDEFHMKDYRPERNCGFRSIVIAKIGPS